MLTTVLFDMGGTLEDIWYNEDTQRATCRRLLEVLRANGLEPGCPDDVFWKRITDGVKAYKQWSEGNMLEKSRRRFGRTGIFGTLPLTGKSCCPSPRSWPTCGRSPSTTGSSATARQRCCRP